MFDEISVSIKKLPFVKTEKPGRATEKKFEAIENVTLGLGGISTD